ncbi:MAG: dephospho-CoA kinase [Candidatus Aquicultorales bacterium]
MKVIAVTGQIGAGKSSVSKLLATYGVRVFSADAIARRLLEPETEAYSEVVDFFGEGILNEDGTVDRKKLASIVFSDPAKLKILNEIIHPRVTDELRDSLEYIGRSGEGIDMVAIDVPMLYGSGVEGLVDKAVAVLADEKVRLERLERQGMEEEDARAREGVQTPEAELRRRADFVIENNGSLQELKDKTYDLWRALEEDD